MVRVCAIYGSESGNSERRIKALTKDWPASLGFSRKTDLMSGNEAAARGLASLAKAYDVVVVSTSSYGDGDPPDNFTKFLAALYAAEGEPLAGVQHCVLGFGSTDYETFQNNPRLTDKLLGERGSRRMLARVEVDENETLAGDAAVAKFAVDVVDALEAAASTKASPPACAWTEPEALILDKKDELLAAGAAGLPVPLLATVAVAVAAAAAYAAFF